MKNRALCGFIILTIGLGIVANILLSIKVQALNKSGNSILFKSKNIRSSNHSDFTSEEEKLLNLKYLTKSVTNSGCNNDEVMCSQGECSTSK